MTEKLQREPPRTTSRSSVDPPAYWFRAKPSGLGWDWPLCWQGWLSYALALAGIIAGVVLFPPRHSPVAFVVANSAVVLLLVGICAVKGEPLRKR